MGESGGINYCGGGGGGWGGGLQDKRGCVRGLRGHTDRRRGLSLCRVRRSTGKRCARWWDVVGCRCALSARVCVCACAAAAAGGAPVAVEGGPGGRLESGMRPTRSRRGPLTCSHLQTQISRSRAFSRRKLPSYVSPYSEPTLLPRPLPPLGFAPVTPPPLTPSLPATRCPVTRSRWGELRPILGLALLTPRKSSQDPLTWQIRALRRHLWTQRSQILPPRRF